MSYKVLCRKPIVINTDPQRRCYDGVMFSSKTEWSDWGEVCTHYNYDDAAESRDLFKSINESKGWQYKIVEEVKF
jgi:hypothetical protein